MTSTVTAFLNIVWQIVKGTAWLLIVCLVLLGQGITTTSINFLSTEKPMTMVRSKLSVRYAWQRQQVRGKPMDAPFRSRNYQALSSTSSTSQLCDFDVVIQGNKYHHHRHNQKRIQGLRQATYASGNHNVKLVTLTFTTIVKSQFMTMPKPNFP